MKQLNSTELMHVTGGIQTNTQTFEQIIETVRSFEKIMAGQHESIQKMANNLKG